MGALTLLGQAVKSDVPVAPSSDTTIRLGTTTKKKSLLKRIGEYALGAVALPRTVVGLNIPYGSKKEALGAVAAGGIAAAALTPVGKTGAAALAPSIVKKAVPIGTAAVLAPSVTKSVLKTLSQPGIQDVAIATAIGGPVAGAAVAAEKGLGIFGKAKEFLQENPLLAAGLAGGGLLGIGTAAYKIYQKWKTPKTTELIPQSPLMVSQGLAPQIIDYGAPKEETAAAPVMGPAGQPIKVSQKVNVEVKTSAVGKRIYTKKYINSKIYNKR